MLGTDRRHSTLRLVTHIIVLLVHADHEAWHLGLSTIERENLETLSQMMMMMVMMVIYLNFDEGLRVRADTPEELSHRSKLRLVQRKLRCGSWVDAQGFQADTTPQTASARSLGRRPGFPSG